MSLPICRTCGKLRVTSTTPPMPLCECEAAPVTAGADDTLVCDECGDPATVYGDGHYCDECARTLAEADAEMTAEAEAQAREP